MLLSATGKVGVLDWPLTAFSVSPSYRLTVTDHDNELPVRTDRQLPPTVDVGSTTSNVSMLMLMCDDSCRVAWLVRCYGQTGNSEAWMPQHYD